METKKLIDKIIENWEKVKKEAMLENFESVKDFNGWSHDIYANLETGEVKKSEALSPTSWKEYEKNYVVIDGVTWGWGENFLDFDEDFHYSDFSEDIKKILIKNGYTQEEIRVMEEKPFTGLTWESFLEIGGEEASKIYEEVKLAIVESELENIRDEIVERIERELKKCRAQKLLDVIEKKFGVEFKSGILCLYTSIPHKLAEILENARDIPDGFNHDEVWDAEFIQKETNLLFCENEEDVVFKIVKVVEDFPVVEIKIEEMEDLIK